MRLAAASSSRTGIGQLGVGSGSALAQFGFLIKRVAGAAHMVFIGNFNSAAYVTGAAKPLAINIKMKRADTPIKAVQADSSPMLFANGMYCRNYQSAGSWENAEAVTLHLVAQESATAN